MPDSADVLSRRAFLLMVEPSSSRALGEVHIRIAQPADVGAITALINTAFADAESFFVTGDRVDQKSVREFFSTGAFLLADKDTELMGCVYVVPEAISENGPSRIDARAYLGLLSVNPELQQSGLGSFLMNAAEEYCANLGARFMDLKVVNLREELFDFYQKRGYEITGTSPFPSDVKTHLPVHFVHMTKHLLV